MQTLPEILTELVGETRKYGEGFTEQAHIALAITNATEQIEAQQSCRICDGDAAVCDACHLAALENTAQQQWERVEIHRELLIRAMVLIEAHGGNTNEAARFDFDAKAALAELEK